MLRSTHIASANDCRSSFQFRVRDGLVLFSASYQMAKGLTLTSTGKFREVITGGVGTPVEVGVQGFDYKAQGGYHGPPSLVDIP